MRIAYLAGNDIEVDARVLKYIDAAKNAGHTVHAFGSTMGVESYEATVHEVPVTVSGEPAGHRRTATPMARRASRPWFRARLVFRMRYPNASAQTAAVYQVDHWRLRARRGTGVRRLMRRGVASIGRRWLRSRPAPVESGASFAQRFTDPLLRAHELDVYFGDPRFSWRDELPKLSLDENQLSDALNAFEPDIVHVHDVFMLAVATRAVEHAAAQGRRVALVYDAHEYIIGLTHLEPRLRAAYVALEQAYIARADAVVTVSPHLASLLARDHGLDEVPAVVLNAPLVAAPPSDFVDVRDLAHVRSAPLMVYVGGINAARGVETAVCALQHMPSVHLVLVTNRVNKVVRRHIDLAYRLGVGARLHIVDFVDPRLVPAYVSRATIGLSTLLHTPNHEVAITNKFCEYLQASLPILTSDTEAQADLVRTERLGAVYEAGNIVDFVAKARMLIRHHDGFQQSITARPDLLSSFHWDAQVGVLNQVYARIESALTAPV